MKKYLIFDLDRVLFNTGFLIRLFKKNKVQVRDKVGAFTIALAKQIDWSQIKADDLVYGEVFEFLSWLSNKNFVLLIFSEGDIRGQLFKLKFSGLDKFFPKEKRFIFEDNKEKEFSSILKKIPKNAQIWYFDDKPEKLRHAKDSNGKTITVLMRHGPWWKSKLSDFEPDYKIKSLREIKEFL